MSNARNLARLIVDSGGDVDVSSLGNVPPSNDASALTTGTLGSARFPSGSIVKIQHDYVSTIVGATNSNMTFYGVNAFTKTVSTNPVMVIGHMMWGGDNPNGYWALEYSDNGGSSWNWLAHLYEADEMPGALGNIACFNFAYNDTSTYTTRSYRVYWYHSVQNGGTMWRNRPPNLQSWSGSGKAQSGVTIYEVQP